jgi:E3 ubiquitin-protein ligase RNF5
MESLPLNENISPSYTDSQQQGEGESDNESAFICNICLEVTYKDPVVTLCGHLYCWSCLYRWLNTQHTECPVCKANVSKDNVIPLFIRGTDQDPRLISQSVDNTIPNRPGGRRPEAQLLGKVLL